MGTAGMSADQPNMGLLGGLRNLAGVGSLLPVAAGATGVGLLTRNRRAGVNFLTTYWPQLLLRINGVSLNVLGRENLTAQRPAVFIFNHRNNFDAVMTAALVRDNWTGVGKKELERDPISGTIGKLVDTAFIDRDNPQSAVESLHKIEDLARRGLSVIIAPEGTRVDTAEVGPFKKGPFRIAMSAGVPIVPIVIRNAEDVAARNASTLHPGTVDVAVFTPIPTTDWTIRTLPRRIAAVRQLYIDTLADWPANDVLLARRAKAGRTTRRKATPITRPEEPS
jgi:putative phosphoserine phosphatase/1-acylglycerol-3-phosphate O-acyltransferase